MDTKDTQKEESPKQNSSGSGFLKSRIFKSVTIFIGSLLLAIIIFAAGVSVGIHKARYSYTWGQNYERNFMGAPGERGMMGMFRNAEGRDFRNSHGTAGVIVSVTDKNILIRDRDNKENTVTVTDRTIIKEGRENIKIVDLKPDERIVIIGRPGDNGTINADLIRVFNNLPFGQN